MLASIKLVSQELWLQEFILDIGKKDSQDTKEKKKVTEVPPG